MSTGPFRTIFFNSGFKVHKKLYYNFWYNNILLKSKNGSGWVAFDRNGVENSPPFQTLPVSTPEPFFKMHSQNAYDSVLVSTLNPNFKIMPPKWSLMPGFTAFIFLKT